MTKRRSPLSTYMQDLVGKYGDIPFAHDNARSPMSSYTFVNHGSVPYGVKRSNRWGNASPAAIAVDNFEKQQIPGPPAIDFSPSRWQCLSASEQSDIISPTPPSRKKDFCPSNQRNSKVLPQSLRGLPY